MRIDQAGNQLLSLAIDDHGSGGWFRILISLDPRNALVLDEDAALLDVAEILGGDDHDIRQPDSIRGLIGPVGEYGRREKQGE